MRAVYNYKYVARRLNFTFNIDNVVEICLGLSVSVASTFYLHPLPTSIFDFQRDESSGELIHKEAALRQS